MHATFLSDHPRIRCPRDGVNHNLALNAFLDSAVINQASLVLKGIHPGSDGHREGDFSAKERFMHYQLEQPPESHGDIDCGNSANSITFDYASLKLGLAEGAGTTAAIAAGVVGTLVGGPGVGATVAAAAGGVDVASGGVLDLTPYLCAGSAPITSPTPQLRASSGSAAAGDSLTLVGSGFGSNTDSVADLHSDPVRLASFKTDAQGAFSVRVTIPRSTRPGTHHIVVTMSDGKSADTVIQVLAPSPLARTGIGLGNELAVSVIALLFGGLLLVPSRRRRRRAAVS